MTDLFPAATDRELLKRDWKNDKSRVTNYWLLKAYSVLIICFGTYQVVGFFTKPILTGYHQLNYWSGAFNLLMGIVFLFRRYRC